MGLFVLFFMLSLKTDIFLRFNSWSRFIISKGFLPAHAFTQINLSPRDAPLKIKITFSGGCILFDKYLSFLRPILCWIIYLVCQERNTKLSLLANTMMKRWETQ